MQCRLDEEQKKFEQRLGYSTEEQLNQKLSQIKAAKVPIDKKKLAYDKLMSDITTESNKLKAETKLEDDQKEKIASRLRNAMQLVSAACNEEENASIDRQRATKGSSKSPRSTTPARKPREQFQRDSIERRETEIGREQGSCEPCRSRSPSQRKTSLHNFRHRKLKNWPRAPSYKKSELQGVLDAAVAFQTADQNLRTEGKGTYADFNKALNNVRQAAEDYKKTHEKPSSSAGKVRLKASEEILKNATEVQRVVSAKHEEIRKLADAVFTLAKQDKATATWFHPRRPEKISLCRDRNQGLYRQDHQGGARRWPKGRRDVQQA